MTEILKELDCTGLSEGGEPVKRAYIERNGYGTIGIHIHTRWSSGGGSPFKTVDDAEYAIRARLDGFVPVLDQLQQEAVDLLKALGPFVKKEERQAIEYYTAFETRDRRYFQSPLVKAMASIKARVDDKRQVAKAGPAPKISALNDDQVVAGLRYLTGLDGDMASKPNHEGWSPTVSGKGHLACHLLDIDRDAAIKIARGFIGGYTKQLRAGGIL